MSSVGVQQGDGSVEELAVQPPFSGVEYPAPPPQLLQRVVMRGFYLQEMDDGGSALRPCKNPSFSSSSLSLLCLSHDRYIPPQADEARRASQDGQGG